MDEYNWDDWDNQASEYLNSDDYSGGQFNTPDDLTWGNQSPDLGSQLEQQGQAGWQQDYQDNSQQGIDYLQGMNTNQDWNFGNYNGMYDFGGQQAQGGQGSNDISKYLSGAGSALKDIFAPRSATSTNPEWGNIINALRGVAGMGKTGLGFMSAADEKEKQQKYLDYINNLRMQTQQSGALDPSAPYRQEAAGYWQQNNPTLQTLLSGGTTANMQQELNAARLAAQRQGGKSGNRFSAFAAKQEPYMMAQARKNDFQMQQEAQKQRWAELATKGDTGSMMDLIKLNANAYRDSLTNPMYAAGGKALQDFLGQSPSVDGNQLMEILSKIQSNTRQQ